MRTARSLVVLAVLLSIAVSPALGQTGAKLHEIDGFISKGVFSELDPGLMKRRLSMSEIEKAKLDGTSADIDDILAWVAKCEKMGFRVEEPLEVRGQMAVALPPNVMGDEAFAACFYAFNFNGLGLSGVAQDMVLVRPEKHPRLELMGRPWNRDQILSTRLFHLGYLNPDPIMRQYQDKLGTAAGHAVIEHRSNVLIVTDSSNALKALQTHVDSAILEAMGVPVSDEQPPAEVPRSPSLGAIASRETIHFYLMAFARWNRFPLAATEQKPRVSRYYPEADLWTDQEGYNALAAEYERIGAFVQLARETGGQGWVETNRERTLSPGDQKRLAIRFGVVLPAAGKPAAPKAKKSARKR